MRFNLVYSNSGDELPFEAEYPEMVEQYVADLQSLEINEFARFGKQCCIIEEKLDNLQTTIFDINEFIDLFLDKKLMAM